MATVLTFKSKSAKPARTPAHEQQRLFGEAMKLLARLNTRQLLKAIAELKNILVN
jgi:hypothetical protein